MFSIPQFFSRLVGVLWLFSTFSLASNCGGDELLPDIRVGAASVNLECDDSMVIAGSIRARYVQGQEGELRAVTVVIEKPGQTKLAIVACDVLWIPRHLVEAVLEEIERSTGIPPEHVLINATHTHHAPSTAPAHDFGVSLPFCEILKRGIIRSVEDANANLENGASSFFFHLGEEKTVGGNSRLKLPNGNITWIRPLDEAGEDPVPTGPFDPELPVLDFRAADGKTRALIFNHSTHTIGTRGGNVRSPSFYGLAAQELEAQLGGVVSFLEGASGSTHNITAVPVDEAVVRMKQVVLDARSRAERRSVDRLAAIRKPFKFRVRNFNNAEEDRKIAAYTTQYLGAEADYVRGVFANMRKQLESHQGEERETWIQGLVIGDVAIVGVPAEYFTSLGVDIKQRSPFKYTYVAELANDWIGYLPDREGHKLGGYQTWTGLHSYAEIGTGERMANEVVALLHQLAVPENEQEAKPAATQNEPNDAIDLGTQFKPQTPAGEQASFHLADDALRLELVASEPDVISPVAIAWDADGWMYVAEMVGYPDSSGLGRIKRLEDRDGNGEYETSTIFAEGLSFPTSVMPYRDGVFVAAAPDILFLRDTNGDGRADERQVVWTGFKADSQQLRANALHWGIDNWIYGANGRCDGEIRPGADPSTEPISIRARDFRFRPDENRFEPIPGQSQFGQAHDDYGNRFLSWNTILARHVAIPEEYLRGSSSLAAAAVVDVSPEDDLGEVFPISPPPIQFNSERANSFNALCGLTVYRGHALGAAYAGNLFAAESLTNLVTRRKLKPAGSTFISERTEIEAEFLAAEDPWFHPVFLTTGPDGALYIVDFYREFVEHPRYVASEEIRNRIDWRNGFAHGRIWRVFHKDHEIDRRSPQLSKAPTSALVKQFNQPVGWQRDTAQRLIVQRQDPATVAPLQQLANQGESTVARLHALWTLDGLNALKEPVVFRALVDSDPIVREHALRLCDPFVHDSPRLLERMLTLEADAAERVRFQLALSARAIADVETRIHLSSNLVLSSGGESWLARAILASAAADIPQLLIAVIEKDPKWLRNPSETQFEFLLYAAKACGVTANAEDVSAVLSCCSECADQEFVPPGQLALACGLARGMTTEGIRSADIWDKQPNLRLEDLIAACTDLAVDSNASVGLRQIALEMLRYGASEDVGDVLLAVIDNQHSAALQTTAVESAFAVNDAGIARQLFSNWSQKTAGSRRLIVRSSLLSSASVAALLDAIERDEVSVHEIPIEVETQLKQIADQHLAIRIADIFVSDTSPDRDEVLVEYRSALTLSGNAVHGAAVFSKHCLACHAIQRFGKQLGPDLTALSGRPSEVVLVDILDPNRQVSADFLAYTCLTVDGKTHVGLIESETHDLITVRTADDKQLTIPLTDVEEFVASGASLMPEGFEKKLSHQEMADLLAFLRRPQRRLLKEAEKIARESP